MAATKHSKEVKLFYLSKTFLVGFFYVSPYLHKMSFIHSVLVNIIIFKILTYLLFQWFVDMCSLVTVEHSKHHHRPPPHPCHPTTLGTATTFSVQLRLRALGQSCPQLPSRRTCPHLQALSICDGTDYRADSAHLASRHGRHSSFSLSRLHGGCSYSTLSNH